MTRTFQQMADEALLLRYHMIAKGDYELITQREFPMTLEEMKLSRKKPFREDAPQATYGDRFYGLRVVLKYEQI